MIATQSIEQAFLADMKSNPDDHSIPLIFADYLSDEGQEDRASLIRIQDYLRRFPHGVLDPKEVAFWNSQQKWQQELIGKNVFEWCYPILAGRTWSVSGNKVYAPESTSGRREYEIHFRRGFVSLIKCRLAEWYDDSDGQTRMTPSCDGRDIVKHHPLLSRVEIVDKEPVHFPSDYSQSWSYYHASGEALAHWAEMNQPNEENVIPGRLWKLVYRREGCRTEQEAKQALSDACLKWANGNG